MQNSCTYGTANERNSAMTAVTEPTLRIAQRVKQALAERLRATGIVCDGKGYVGQPKENVLCPDAWPAIHGDLTNGAGDELGSSRTGLPPKFCAAHSSSALAANAFGPWRNDPRTLSVRGMSGFISLQFEHVCSAGVRGTAPHLDALARTPNSALAIESKCTEYLQPKIPAFAEAYERIEDTRRASAWFTLISNISVRQRFAHLDAAQLVKHYLGLANTFSSGRVVLLYLFWEPLNADDFSIFRDHRRELHEFAEIVAGDRVEFMYVSYPELWQEWDVSCLGSRRQHVAALRTRYSVYI
jgi:Restriction Endonuclease associating with ARP